MTWKEFIASLPKLAGQIYDLTHDLAKVQTNVEKHQEELHKVAVRLVEHDARLKHTEDPIKLVAQLQTEISTLKNEIATLKSLHEKSDQNRQQQDALRGKDLELSQVKLERLIEGKTRDLEKSFEDRATKLEKLIEEKLHEKAEALASQIISRVKSAQPSSDSTVVPTVITPISSAGFLPPPSKPKQGDGGE